MSSEGRARAFASLRGLAVGDGFGSCFEDALNRDALKERRLLPGPWLWTDDTQMACSIFAVLDEYGRIEQDALARSFAEHYDIYRRYGPGTSRILRLIRQKGSHWRDLAARARDGQGSWGNGAAMRVAPLGAWFADDLDRVRAEAAASAEVTHTHPDAIAGAVAVAVAAAYRATTPDLRGPALLDAVGAHTPHGAVRHAITYARSLGDHITAATKLGVGHRTSALDTVPFTLWIVAHHGHDFAEACWTAAAAGGDIDTTCAIIGGILGARETSVPPDWLSACEPLPDWIE